MNKLCVLLLVSLFLVSGYLIVDIISSDLARYVAESECVESKITLGIERSDIATANGTCWVRESALNNPLNTKN